MIQTRFSMVAWSVAALFVAGITAGCSETAKGIEKDSAVAGEAVDKNTKDIQAGVKKDAGNIGAALSLTPVIKAAFIANPFLKESGNEIDVNSNAETVTLTGHVKSEKNRQLAEDTAAKILKDKGSKNKLINEITVVP